MPARPRAVSARSPRFNGASSSRTRMRSRRRAQGQGGRASMGPRPRGRGCAVVVVLVVHRQEASMGPRPRGRGCLGERVGSRRLQLASMGPRPRGRGCCDEPWLHAQTADLLQWGLVLADEDASLVDPISTAPDPASMGPRPRGRGCVLAVGGRADVAFASMGPRPRGRGCGGTRDRVAGEKPLQWGLVLADENAGEALIAQGAAHWRFNGASSSRTRMLPGLPDPPTHPG